MTLKLCGFSASNYYNQIKLQLLEKQLGFEEELVLTGHRTPASWTAPRWARCRSSIPVRGCISESHRLCRVHRGDLPAVSLAAGRPACGGQGARTGAVYRTAPGTGGARVVPAGLFRRQVSVTKPRSVHASCWCVVPRHSARIAHFAPFVAGDQFTLADCAAIVHLPVIAGATKLTGEDLLAALPVQGLPEAPWANARRWRKVNADRKADTQRMLAARAPSDAAAERRAQAQFSARLNGLALPVRRCSARSGSFALQEVSTASANAGCASQCVLRRAHRQQGPAILCSPCAPPSKR
jgi:glutathione S-transferase